MEDDASGWCGGAYKVNSGGGVVHSCNVRHGVGMGQKKTRNRATMAQFRAGVGLQEA